MPTFTEQMSGVKSFSGTVGASVVYVDLSGQTPPFTVQVVPGSGCTVSVSYSAVNNSATTPAAAGEWEEWEAGAVDASKIEFINARITGIKFTRESGSVTSAYYVIAS